MFSGQVSGHIAWDVVSGSPFKLYLGWLEEGDAQDSKTEYPYIMAGADPKGVLNVLSGHCGYGGPSRCCPLSGADRIPRSCFGF